MQYASGADRSGGIPRRDAWATLSDVPVQHSDPGHTKPHEHDDDTEECQVAAQASGVVRCFGWLVKVGSNNIAYGGADLPKAENVSLGTSQRGYVHQSYKHHASRNFALGITGSVLTGPAVDEWTDSRVNREDVVREQQDPTVVRFVLNVQQQRDPDDWWNAEQSQDW